MAGGFQAIHQAGPRNKDEELELIKGLELGEYKLYNFVSTEADDVAVVTYTVTVEENIEGKVMPTSPAQRMSVFVKTENGWQWIAHANLIAMGK